MEREQAVAQLMEELAAGRASGESEGWLTLEEVEKALGMQRMEDASAT